MTIRHSDSLIVVRIPEGPWIGGPNKKLWKRKVIVYRVHDGGEKAVHVSVLAPVQPPMP